ncbi:zf-HC2 domain-containing protein [Calditrichota bacterium GD2]
MKCEQARFLMMGYLDGELDEKEKAEFLEHLNSCPDCQAEWPSFNQLKEESKKMKFRALPEMYWDEYWQQVYNRIERGIGWILFSLGAIIVLAFAGYEVLKEFFLDASQPLVLRIGMGLLMLGFIVLFISVLREKLMVRRHDKYRRIIR